MCMQKREILTIFLLSIVTCGIYGLYWLVITTDDINESSDYKITSGGLSLVLFFITCGIYGFYWYYQLGRQIGELSKNKNLALIALLCSIISFGTIGMVIMQDEINRLIDNEDNGDNDTIYK